MTDSSPESDAGHILIGQGGLVRIPKEKYRGPKLVTPVNRRPVAITSNRMASRPEITLKKILSKNCGSQNVRQLVERTDVLFPIRVDYTFFLNELTV